MQHLHDHASNRHDDHHPRLLFADLRRFLPRGEDGPQSYILPAGATVADLLAAIGVPPDDEVTPGLNGELAQRDTVLHDGDDLVLFGLVEGG